MLLFDSMNHLEMDIETDRNMFIENLGKYYLNPHMSFVKRLSQSNRYLISITNI